MPITGVVLDHVAVAVERWTDAWPRYVEQLGGRWSSGGLNVGFGPAQLTFANGARIEILQPHRVEDNPFLRRFLDSSGPGPHHMTFKVADISEAIDLAEAAGFTPVNVDLSDPGWKEAFLHPRQATGVVVQLAQAASSWESPAPDGFPTVAPANRAELRHVTHAVADLELGLALFRDLLAGEPTSVLHAQDGSWQGVTLRWSGPLALRLVAPTPGSDGGDLATWLSGRAGRVHHLAFEQRGAAPSEARQTSGVLASEIPCQVIEPEDNFGVRLVIGSSGTTSSLA